MAVPGVDTQTGLWSETLMAGSVRQAGELIAD